MGAERVHRWLLCALLLYHLAFSAGYFWVTRVAGIWPWPFSRGEDGAAQYLRLAAYLPVLAGSLAALTFARIGGQKVSSLYARGEPDWRAAGVLLACIAYSSVMLLGHPAPFDALAAWPPLLGLCAMNAFAEESLYRGVFLVVVGKATARPLLRYGLPALAYAGPHLAISTSLACVALGFGLVLHWVRLGRGGLWACIGCHFVADIGAIGRPFLPEGPG